MSAIDQSIADESSAEFGTTFFEFSIAESYTVASVRKSFHIVILYTDLLVSIVVYGNSIYRETLAVQGLDCQVWPLGFI